MKEEKYLEERVSRQNPFRVPEGYFESFADQVMAQLPEHEQKVRRMIPRPWMYAAASLIVAVSCVTIYFSKISSNEPQEAPQMVAVSESYMDEAADYAMIDNTDIYACLADN